MSVVRVATSIGRRLALPCHAESFRPRRRFLARRLRGRRRMGGKAR